MLQILLLVVAVATTRSFSLPGWFSVDLWWLLFPAIILRIEMLRRRLPWRFEFLAGVLFWLLTFSFLKGVHILAPFGASLIMGTTFVVEALVFRNVARKFSTATAACLALPACEFVRMNWFYLAVGGVPWGTYAAPLADTPLLPLASAIGESGLVILVISLSAAFYSFWRRSAKTPVLITVVLLLASNLLISKPPQPLKSIDCLSIQPNISVHQKNDKMFAEEFFDIQYQLSKKAMLEHPDFDLLLWAETMWPLPAIEEGQNGEIRRPWPGEEDELLDMQLMERLQRETVSYLMALAPDDAHFMTGSHFYAVAIDGQHSERSTDFLLFNKSGELLQHASKRLLVPFGEILPFNNRFPGATWICDLAQSQFGLRPDFVVSEQVGPFQSRGQLPSLGGAVCWENVFESPFREQADSGASAFVILSNEDWLGSDGLEMTQMVSATKFRAAETGRHVVRATNTGISCRVSPSGAVAAGPAIGERGYWLTELPIIEAKYQTNYQRMGWMLAPIWLVVCLIVLVVNILCKRSLDLSPKNK